MQTTTRFTIAGTGAVGGFYGGLLQKAGFDVRFLLNSDFDYVQKNGLKIDSVNGDFHLPNVQAYRDPQKIPESDVVIVALKTTANDALKTLLPNLVSKHTLILTLQNGLGSEAEIASICGAENVIGGLCFLCSNKIGPGHIRHLDYGLITLGEYHHDGSAGGRTPRLEKLGNELNYAGIPIRLVDDLPLARWKKLVWNIPFNGMSVVENTLTDTLITHPETRGLCLKMMEEVSLASAACARPIEAEFLEKMVADTEKMKPYAPSMKLDYDRGNPMEIEAIYGNPIRMAHEHGIPMPETEKLYDRLRALNKVI